LVFNTLQKLALGGNVLNCAIALARLGIPSPKLLTKLGNDYLGNHIVDTLKAEGVDTNSIVYKDNATSSFSYIIVDQSTKTRTCINNPCEYLQDISEIVNHQSLLDDVKILIIDGKHPDVACQVYYEVINMLLIQY
jgi:sugar/nucleoside kinase (ribokinase family)